MVINLESLPQQDNFLDTLLQIKRQKRNLITPQLALTCAYLFELYSWLIVPNFQKLSDSPLATILFLSFVLASGSQIICTARACFLRPKTLLKKAVFVIAIIPMLLAALIKIYVVGALIYSWIF